MKTWKKLLSLTLIILSSVLTFFACGKVGKYDNMTLTVVSYDDKLSPVNGIFLII